MKKIANSKLVESLMYSMVCTKPDIAVAASFVSRFLANAKVEHWNIVKCIL